MNRTGDPHQPTPGRSLFLLRHEGGRREGPATLIRGAPDPNLSQTPPVSHYRDIPGDDLRHG